MAVELVRLVWCDVCLHDQDGTKTDAEVESVIAIGSSAAMLALCELHAKELLTPLAGVLHLGDAKHEAVQRLNAKPAKASPPPVPSELAKARGRANRKGGDVACPVAGCDYSGPSDGAAHHHTLREHGMTLAEARGTAVPASAMLPCPLCAKVMKGIGGFGMHLTKTHRLPPGEARPMRDKAAMAWRAENAGQLALPGGP